MGIACHFNLKAEVHWVLTMRELGQKKISSEMFYTPKYLKEIRPKNFELEARSI
jgi:hypothetical protein